MPHPEIGVPGASVRVFYDNGDPLAYIKDQLGHSSIKVTVDVYGHLVPGANRQAVNRLPVLKNATQAQQAPKQKKGAL